MWPPGDRRRLAPLALPRLVPLHKPLVGFLVEPRSLRSLFQLWACRLCQLGRCGGHWCLFKLVPRLCLCQLCRCCSLLCFQVLSGQFQLGFQL